ncbi:MAG: MmgE/PrpD family protein, partial [Chloroflexota bacterium]|nr:MmgE/PrpD family protein [Chloroflexota bacterium]
VGRHTPWGRTIAQFAIDEGFGQGNATVIGYPKLTVPGKAALANGTFAYSYEYNDSIQIAPSHVYPIVVPAALAIAERQGSTGADLLTAVVAGVEVHARVGMGVAPHARVTSTVGRGLCSSQVYGAFGGAATAARLLHLDAEKTAMAMGIAADYAGGNFQGMAEGAWTRQWHSGVAAEGGITAALLAQRGFIGPLKVLEGEQSIYKSLVLEHDTSLITQGLGKSYQINDIWIKRFPVNMGWMGGIEAVLDLRKEHNINPDQVEKLYCDHFLITPLHAGRDFHNIALAQFNPAFCLAVAMVKGRCTIDDFTDEGLKDPKVGAFATDRVEARFDEEMTRLGYEKATRPVRIRVKMKDGKEYSKEVIFTRGHPRNPMNAAELKEKFDTLATRTISKEKAKELYETIRGLDKARDIKRLSQLLRG